MSGRELLITGLGPVSPIGVAVEELAAAIAGRESAVDAVEVAGIEGPAPRVARMVDFELRDYLTSEKTYLDEVTSYLLAGCALAKEDANLTVDAGNRDRVGLCLAAAYGPLGSADRFQSRVAAKGARVASPLIFGHTYINTAASLVAIEWGVRGFDCIVAGGLVAGAAAIAQGADALRLGAADALLCGGSDAASDPLVRGLAAQGLLAREGEEGGLVPGDGAGVIVLETPENAAARGAEAKGVLLAAATAFGADLGSSLGDAIDLALAEAGAAAGDISLVTSCRNGHPAIAAAADALYAGRFAHADTLSLRELTGETFAAAPGIDIAAALLTLDPGQLGLVTCLDWLGASGALVVRR
jgi:3-oxoacyl-[acyl-carrier-protein] synthase II